MAEHRGLSRGISLYWMHIWLDGWADKEKNQISDWEVYWLISSPFSDISLLFNCHKMIRGTKCHHAVLSVQAPFVEGQIKNLYVNCKMNTFDNTNTFPVSIAYSNKYVSLNSLLIFTASAFLITYFTEDGSLSKILIGIWAWHVFKVKY